METTTRRHLSIRLADPAGNLTIFVLDPVPRQQYQTVASQLLAMPDLGGEQVAFVTGPDSMEMCGLEFCGNASRSFALMQAEDRGLSGKQTVDISVSGCADRLHVEVDTTTHYTKIRMPRPRRILPPGVFVPAEADDTAAPDVIPQDAALHALLTGATLVDMDGILHVILQDIPASRETFDAIRDYVDRRFDPPAMGVMFYDTRARSMVPVVYVRDVDSTYFEGSCGSGTVAAASALCLDKTDGSFSVPLAQPAGSITATIEKTDGALHAVYIEGPVTLHPVRRVTVSL